MSKKNTTVFVVIAAVIVLGLVMLVPRLFSNSAYRDNSANNSNAWNNSMGTTNSTNTSSNNYDLNPSATHSGAENYLEPNNRQNSTNQQLGTSSTSRTSE